MSIGASEAECRDTDLHIAIAEQLDAFTWNQHAALFIINIGIHPVQMQNRCSTSAFQHQDTLQKTCYARRALGVSF